MYVFGNNTQKNKKEKENNNGNVTFSLWNSFFFLGVGKVCPEVQQWASAIMILNFGDQPGQWTKVKSRLNSTNSCQIDFINMFWID